MPWKCFFKNYYYFALPCISQTCQVAEKWLRLCLKNNKNVTWCWWRTLLHLSAAPGRSHQNVTSAGFWLRCGPGFLQTCDQETQFYSSVLVWRQGLRLGNYELINVHLYACIIAYCSIKTMECFKVYSEKKKKNSSKGTLCKFRMFMRNKTWLII